MSDPADSFETLAGRLDYPMLVVTAVSGTDRAGCLVGFHTQCSIKPVRYAVWISQVNRTHEIALRADALALHFLGRENHDLASLFGGATGDDTDKFARCDWSPGLHGVPLLNACPTRVVATRHALFADGSDHTCLVVDPAEVSVAAAGVAALMFSEVQDIDAGHPVS